MTSSPSGNALILKRQLAELRKHKYLLCPSLSLFAHFGSTPHLIPPLLLYTPFLPSHRSCRWLQCRFKEWRQPLRGEYCGKGFIKLSCHPGLLELIRPSLLAIVKVWKHVDGRFKFIEVKLNHPSPIVYSVLVGNYCHRSKWLVEKPSLPPPLLYSPSSLHTDSLFCFFIRSLLYLQPLVSLIAFETFDFDPISNVLNFNSSRHSLWRWFLACWVDLPTWISSTTTQDEVQHQDVAPKHLPRR